MKIAQHFLVVFLVLVIAATGFYYHIELLNRSMVQFRNMSFLVTGFGFVGNPILFTLSLLGVIPLYFIANRLAPIRHIGSAVLFLFMTYTFGMLFWWLRLKYLIWLSEGYSIHPQIQNSIRVESFLFEIYTLVGLITGAVISGFVIKQINRISSTKHGNKPENDLLD